MRTPTIRRPRLTYANVASTLALILAVSMGGAYAHGKVGSWHIKHNAVKSRHIGWQQVKTGDLAKQAVTTNRIKARAVGRGKLKPNARPKTYLYQAPGHDFSANCLFQLHVPIPDWRARRSTWRASLQVSNGWVEVPGPYIGAHYEVRWNESFSQLQIRADQSCSNAIEATAIRVFRTEADVVKDGDLTRGDVGHSDGAGTGTGQAP